MKALKLVKAKREDIEREKTRDGTDVNSGLGLASFVGIQPAKSHNGCLTDACQIYILIK